MELMEHPDLVDSGKHEKSVAVRRYRCLDPIANESEAIEILFKRNQLWNQYVESFQRHQLEAEALRQGENTHYAQLKARYVETTERYSALIVQKKATKNRASRATTDEHAAITAGIATVRAERIEIAVALKSAHAEARVTSKATTDAVWKRFNMDKTRLGHASGVWWGNRETVREAFENAVIKLGESGGTMLFHRFDGTGSLRVRAPLPMPMKEVLEGRLQPLRVDAIAGAGDHRSERGKKHVARHVISMRIDVKRDDESGKRRFVELALPIILHRDFEMSTFKYATLRRSREAGRFVWHVAFTCVSDAPAKATHLPLTAIASGRAALKLGWREVPEGLRVATLLDGNNKAEFCVLPAEWMQRQDLLQQQQGLLQKHALLWWVTLTAQLPPKPEPDASTGELIREHGLIGAIRNAKAPSYARISSLEDCAHRGEVELPTKLNEELTRCVNTVVDPRFATTARALSRATEFLRAGQLQRRDYLYRNFAATIGARFGDIVLEDTNYAQLAKLFDAAGNKSALHQAERNNRVRANVSDLRLYVEQAVSKRGGNVDRLRPSKITAKCSTCAHINDVAAADARFICGNCDAHHDRDVNAARNLLHESDATHTEFVA